MSGDLRIGVDIGGTFTDVVVRRPGAPSQIMKIPTTRGDPSIAVLEALQRMQAEWGLAPQDVLRFVHGTTVATNAVLERKGAKVGVITTEGFRDVLEIGRQMRHQMYQLALDPETPTFLAPGRMRHEVPERISATGEVLKPLDEAAVADAADALVAAGANAIAVVFLFSFLDDTHEKRAREIILGRHPDVFVSLSSEVDPAFREYERTVVTAFDAYVKPVVDRYLANLDSGLLRASVPAPLQIMQSRGGISGSRTARLRPVRLFLSGPAAGVIGAKMAAEIAGMRDLITVDVGGTSCDIALIEDGTPALRSEGLIDGYPVRVGMVDVNSIGSGGGSIAWLDLAGGLRVGPQSAGSEPGPACYGRGGTEATVTDASIVLGYLDPDYFAGGKLKLKPELARDAVARIAGRLNLTVEQAALGIHRILNAQMAEGIRLVSIRQGHDPRRFTLLPLGGGGALHACPLAEELGLARVLVPRHPGVLSAAGLLAAPIEHEASTALPRREEEFDLGEVKRSLHALDQRCSALMNDEKVERGAISVRYFADVCYAGQGYHLEVPFDPDSADSFGTLTAAFYAAHDRTYGYAPQAPIRLVNLRSVHTAAGLEKLQEDDWSPAAREALIRRTRILLPDQPAPVEAAVYDRAALNAGDTFEGPAIIEQDDTTTLVTPGWRGRVDPHGNLVLERTSN
jgi:N-methylhydantoinase A